MRVEQFLTNEKKWIRELAKYALDHNGSLSESVNTDEVLYLTIRGNTFLISERVLGPQHILSIQILAEEIYHLFNHEFLNNNIVCHAENLIKVLKDLQLNIR